MRISTWNVNGLRAVLKKGLWDFIANECSDVLCLQEVRARPAQIEPESLVRLIERYPWTTWNPAQRPGYSGVGVLTAQPPLEFGQGLGAPQFDNEGRVIWLRYPDFWLYNLYFPNGGHEKQRVDYKLDFYALVLEICAGLIASGEQVILCGDFNTAHQEIDLKNPKENAHTSGFLPEERAWVTRYLEHGFIDAYRQLYPERVQYTWWTYRLNARQRGIGWRLDYILVSEALYHRVKDVVIHEGALGSDHCPVTLVLRD